LTGAGLGAAGTQDFGKESNVGSMIGGAILSTIGTAIGGPIGGTIGGLLGGIFGDEPKKRKKRQEVIEKESVENTKESVRQLKAVNRNLTLMVDKMDPYTLPESYYFSVSNNRGLVY
jgi:outer membrane lipoprotein SlyB